MKILFVDDDQNIIQGYKRTLHSMRNQWTMYFVQSSKEALEFLDKETVDILVTDMRMPEMDGAKLLSIVKEKYPSIARIILSGYSEKEFILKSSTTAHQFLAKPCKIEALINTIQKITTLKEQIYSDEIKALVVGLNQLPSLPQIYLKLEAEINAPNVSVKKIGDLIAKDITMTAKILQLVNSAFFGLPIKINDPVQAANYLGLDTLKSLILLHHIFSSLEKNDSYNLFLENMWKHSFQIANRAKKIMGVIDNDVKKLDQAFISGLLHDIGKLILIQKVEYQNFINNSNCISGKQLRDFEKEKFKTEHSFIGAYLLGLWGLPDFVVESAAFHHDPSLVAETEFTPLAAVHFAHLGLEDESLDKDYIAGIEVLNNKDNFSKIIEYCEGEKNAAQTSVC